MPRWMKHLGFVLLLAVFAGCAGSCDGCAGCGITPIPGGFPAGKRIENAAAARLTQHGLGFISANIGALAPALLGSGSANAGVVSFEVPPTSASGVNVCPGGPDANSNPPQCVVEANLGQAHLTLTTAAPSSLKVSGTLAVRLRSLPLKGLCLGPLCLVDTKLVLSKNADCSANYADIPINVDVSVETDRDAGHGSRTGLSRIKVKAVTFDEAALTGSIKACGGALDPVINALIPTLAGSLIGGLTGTLTTTIEDQLCVKQDAATGVTCPSGSTADASNVCKFADGTCATSSLGMEGNLDVGAALASLSPGTSGAVDFQIAVGGQSSRGDNAPCDGQPCSWGDLNPIANGASLGLVGGAEAAPPTSCVPIAALTRPTGIPIPDELLGNSLPNWSGAGPDVGIGVSERYINYLLGGVYNSGGLCLGIGTDALGSSGSLLSSQTFGLFANSFQQLARQKEKAPLALVIRPQEPPTAEVGSGTDIATDPTLKITLNGFAIDFYVWSNDRFIRGFTATFDLMVPVILDVTADGKLAPVIDKLTINKATLSNYDMIREDPQKVADGLANVVASAVGSALGGAISPVDLNAQLASLGIKLEIPASIAGQGSPGVRKLSKASQTGTDNFLGIFGTLAVGTPYRVIDESETRADLVKKNVTPEGLRADTVTRDNRPSVDLRLTSSLDDGQRSIEYSWRIDGGLWHGWSTERFLKIDDALLSLQMQHRVEVRSRVAGVPASEDRTPAVVDVVIDATAPFMAVAASDDQATVTVDAWDTVSAPEATLVRWSIDGAPATEWAPATAPFVIDVSTASEITVSARDEEGNVASASQALVRGRPDKSLADGTGCACSVPGSHDRAPSWLGALALAALGGIFGLRRGRKAGTSPFGATDEARHRLRLRPRTSLAGIAIAALLAPGCSCSADDETNKGASGGSAGSAGTAGTAGVGSGGTAGTAGTGGTGGNPSACVDPDCETLYPGLIGAYASTAIASDGSLWVAGYNDMGYGVALDGTETDVKTPYLFGDLVIGKVVGGKVQWKTVDGIAAGATADPSAYDTNGWRGGIPDAGDDVGLWTSLAVDGANLEVAYYDATRRTLRFGSSSDNGATWAIHDVVAPVATSDLGRYAKLVISGGKPVIAFLAMEAGGTDGAGKSSVRVATAKQALPAAVSDWDFADVTTNDTAPCRKIFCAAAEECRTDTGKCANATTGCTPACASGEKCFDDSGTLTCAAVATTPAVEGYPDATGLYLSLAATSDGLGLVWYDRVHGNLWAAKQAGGTWGAPRLLDGEDRSVPATPKDTGDMGIGASLFIDAAGDWHVSYVDGFAEAVVYLKLTGGTTQAARSIVDDGKGYPDGNAVVGDDTSILVTASGEVRIAYQDATHGKAKYATGTPGNWTRAELTVPDFAGSFNHVVEVGGATQVVTHWRHALPRTEGDVAVVTP